MPTRSVIQRPRATRGKTVGRAVIKSFIHDYINGQSKDFKPLYTQNRFNAMVEGIQSEHEYSIYLQYVALHNGLAEELVRSQAYAQQAQHGMAHLQIMLDEVRRAQAQDALLDRMTALYGLPMDRDEADALSASLRSLFLSLEALSASESLRANLQSYYVQLLEPSLRGLLAYNTLVTLLAQGLAFAEIQQLASPMDDIDRDIAQYNEDIRLIGPKLTDQALFARLFPPITMQAYAPAPEAVQAVREAIEDPAGLQSGAVQQLFIRLLEHTP